MLHIRPDQFEALSRSVRLNFEDRLIKHLRSAQAALVVGISATDLRSRVRAAVERAMTYGIEIEKDVVQFVTLTFELGPSFDSGAQYPWAKDILTDFELDGEDKVGEIRAWLDARSEEDQDEEKEDPEQDDQPIAESEPEEQTESEY